MSYTISENVDIISYEVKGVLSSRDIHELGEHFDKKIDQRQRAKFLMDFSEMTSRKPKATKMAFNRIEKGFPRRVQVAIVFREKGVYKFLLVALTLSAAMNAKVFEDRDDAKRWLRGVS